MARFEGKASEGVTCNALEWISSYGGGTIVEPDKKVDHRQTRTRSKRSTPPAAGSVPSRRPESLPTARRGSKCLTGWSCRLYAQLALRLRARRRSQERCLREIRYHCFAEGRRQRRSCRLPWRVATNALAYSKVPDEAADLFDTSHLRSFKKNGLLSGACFPRGRNCRMTLRSREIPVV